MASAQEAPPEGCSELTPDAFGALLDTLDRGIAQAASDCDSFCKRGDYGSAAQANLDYLNIVRDQVQELETWLAEVEGNAAFVTNASAAYNVHGLARNAILSLHYARHWATVSATYHGSKAARESFTTTTLAIQQLEALGENGGLCYMAAYGPFEK